MQTVIIKFPLIEIITVLTFLHARFPQPTSKYIRRRSADCELDSPARSTSSVGYSLAWDQLFSSGEACRFALQVPRQELTVFPLGDCMGHGSRSVPNPRMETCMSLGLRLRRFAQPTRAKRHLLRALRTSLLSMFKITHKALKTIVSRYDDGLGGRDVFTLLSARYTMATGRTRTYQRAGSTDPTDPTTEQAPDSWAHRHAYLERLLVRPIGLESLILLCNAFWTSLPWHSGSLICAARPPSH